MNTDINDNSPDTNDSYPDANYSNSHSAPDSNSQTNDNFPVREGFTGVNPEAQEDTAEVENETQDGEPEGEQDGAELPVSLHPTTPNSDPAGLPMRFPVLSDIEETGFDLLTASVGSQCAAEADSLGMQDILVRTFEMKAKTVGKGKNKVLDVNEDGVQQYTKGASEATMTIAMTETQTSIIKDVASQYAIAAIFGPTLIKYANFRKRVANSPADEIPNGMTWTLDAFAKYLGHDIATDEGLEALVIHLYSGSYAPKSSSIGNDTDLKICGLSPDSQYELSVAMDDATQLIEKAATKGSKVYGSAITAAQARSLAGWWKRGAKGLAPSGGSTMVDKALKVYKRKINALLQAIDAAEMRMLADGLSEDDEKLLQGKVDTYSTYKELYSIIECTLTNYLGVLRAKEDIKRAKKATDRQKALDAALSPDVQEDDILEMLDIDALSPEDLGVDNSL